MSMKIAYIAHPVSGDVKGNIEKIIEVVREVNMTNGNVVPFVPYLADLYALDDNEPAERERGIKNDMHILNTGLVDEVWLYGPRISNGMKAEIEFARSRNIPVIQKDIRLTESLKELASQSTWPGCAVCGQIFDDDDECPTGHRQPALGCL